MILVHIPSRRPSLKEGLIVFHPSRQRRICADRIKTIPKGFSLIEFLVAIAILGILTTAAVPSFRTAILNSRVTTQVNKFIGSLHLARSEAVKRGIPVTLCKTADPYANNPTCDTSSANGWEKGWLVFMDKNGDAEFNTNDGDKLLRVHEPLKGDNTLRGNQHISNYINYAPTGVTRKANGSFQSGTLILCDSRGYGEDAKAIVISSTGRPRAESATDSTLNSCQP